VQQLFDRTARHEGYKLTVSLENQTITDEHGLEFAFQIDDFRKHCLLHGLDDIGLTLRHEDKIAAYEAAQD
jgi:3-isopropylmalate/(R)-2-methylmalate dehydratase small subunit